MCTEFPQDPLHLCLLSILTRQRQVFLHLLLFSHMARLSWHIISMKERVILILQQCLISTNHLVVLHFLCNGFYLRYCWVRFVTTSLHCQPLSAIASHCQPLPAIRMWSNLKPPCYIVPCFILPIQWAIVQWAVPYKDESCKFDHFLYYICWLVCMSWWTSPYGYIFSERKFGLYHVTF